MGSGRSRAAGPQLSATTAERRGGALAAWANVLPGRGRGLARRGAGGTGAGCRPGVPGGRSDGTPALAGAGAAAARHRAEDDAGGGAGAVVRAVVRLRAGPAGPDRRATDVLSGAHRGRGRAALAAP